MAMPSIGHDILWRGGLLVTKIEGARQAGMLQQGKEAICQIIDMDAREDLARLDDLFFLAFAHPVQL